MVAGVAPGGIMARCASPENPFPCGWSAATLADPDPSC